MCRNIVRITWRTRVLMMKNIMLIQSDQVGLALKDVMSKSSLSPDHLEVRMHVCKCHCVRPGAFRARESCVLLVPVFQYWCGNNYILHYPAGCELESPQVNK